MGFPDEQTAMKKWKYLRDKYVRVKRQLRAKPSGAGEECEEWTLLPYLEFLEEFVQQRKHYTNVLPSNSAQVDGSDPEEEQIIFEVETQDVSQVTVDNSETQNNELDMQVDSLSDNSAREAVNAQGRYAISPSPPLLPASPQSQTPQRKRRRTSSEMATGSQEYNKNVIDSAFCNYVLSEMRSMNPQKKIV